MSAQGLFFEFIVELRHVLFLVFALHIQVYFENDDFEFAMSSIVIFLNKGGGFSLDIQLMTLWAGFVFRDHCRVNARILSRVCASLSSLFRE